MHTGYARLSFDSTRQIGCVLGHAESAPDSSHPQRGTHLSSQHIAPGPQKSLRSSTLCSQLPPTGMGEKGIGTHAVAFQMLPLVLYGAHFSPAGQSCAKVEHSNSGPSPLTSSQIGVEPVEPSDELPSPLEPVVSCVSCPVESVPALIAVVVDVVESALPVVGSEPEGWSEEVASGSGDAAELPDEVSASALSAGTCGLKQAPARARHVIDGGSKARRFMGLPGGVAASPTPRATVSGETFGPASLGTRGGQGQEKPQKDRRSRFARTRS